MEEMKTSGMVERVARALHTVDDARSRPDLAVEWEACLPVYQKMKLEEARAAIDAMREPTPYMMAATLPIGPIEVDRPTMILCERTLGLLEPDGFPAEAHAGGMDSAQRLVADWRAMVDAALKG